MRLLRFRDHQQRGVATFVAVASIGLVGMATLAWATMLKIDHRRTRSAVVESQLRQLILAGLSEASDRGDPFVAQAVAVSLPSPIAEREAAVSYRFVSTDDASGMPPTRVEISAEYGGSSRTDYFDLLALETEQKMVGGLGVEAE